MIAATALAGSAIAAEGPVPKGVPHLDHVFLIMMENHGYSQLIDNPNAPFINAYAKAANLATNFFAVGHPSLTNYLEVVGGSNFGVLSDHDPDWHNTSCQPNLATGVPNTDNPPTVGADATDDSFVSTPDMSSARFPTDAPLVRPAPRKASAASETFSYRLTSSHFLLPRSDKPNRTAGLPRALAPASHVLLPTPISMG